MPDKTRREHEAEVRSWGFPHVFTWSDGPYVARPSTFVVPFVAFWHRLSWLAAARRVCFLPGFPADSPTNTVASNAHYSPHSHSGVTTHLILKGTFTITYPNDPAPEKVTYGIGDRIDVDAGRIHEVWMGDQGCTYVIGE